MRAVRQMSYEEISDALGINVGTVKSRIARARTSLARSLREQGHGANIRRSSIQ